MHRIYKPILWKIASVLFLILALAACSGKNAVQETTIPIGDKPLPPEVQMSEEEARQAVVLAWKTANELPNRVLTNTEVNNNFYETMIEFIPPDRKRIADDNGDFIIIGKEVYFRPSEGDWSMSSLKSSLFINDNYMAELEDGLQSARLVGTENLNGIMTLIFQYSTNASGISLPTQAQIWVGADGRLYKAEISGSTLSINPDSGQTQTLPSKSTLTFEYDPSIVIVPPVK